MDAKRKSKGERGIEKKQRSSEGQKWEVEQQKQEEGGGG